MNTLIFRVGLLLMHLLVNVIIISYLTRFDISGSWLATGGFLLGTFVLLALLIIHIISFIKFYKKR